MRAPKHRRFLHVGLFLPYQIKESSLGYFCGQPGYCPILQRPVYRKAQALPHFPKIRLIAFDGFHAFFTELASGHIRGMETAVPFHKPFGGKAIVIKAEGIKNIVALHPLKTRYHLRLGIRKNVPDMKAPAYRRRRCVNGKYLFLPAVPVSVNPFLFP